MGDGQSSVEVWPPSSAYKLQPPWKMGVGGMMRLRVQPGGRRVAPGLLWSLWRSQGQSTRIPRVAEVGGETQQPLAGVMQAPCDFTL